MVIVSRDDVCTCAHLHLETLRPERNLVFEVLTFQNHTLHANIKAETRCVLYATRLVRYTQAWHIKHIHLQEVTHLAFLASLHRPCRNFERLCQIRKRISRSSVWLCIDCASAGWWIFIFMLALGDGIAREVMLNHCCSQFTTNEIIRHLNIDTNACAEIAGNTEAMVETSATSFPLSNSCLYVRGFDDSLQEKSGQRASTID